MGFVADDSGPFGYSADKCCQYVSDLSASGSLPRWLIAPTFFFLLVLSKLIAFFIDSLIARDEAKCLPSPWINYVWPTRTLAPKGEWPFVGGATAIGFGWGLRNLWKETDSSVRYNWSASKTVCEDQGRLWGIHFTIMIILIIARGKASIMSSVLVA